MGGRGAISPLRRAERVRKSVPRAADSWRGSFFRGPVRAFPKLRAAAALEREGELNVPALGRNVCLQGGGSDAGLDGCRSRENIRGESRRRSPLLCERLLTPTAVSSLSWPSRACCERGLRAFHL